MFMTLTSIQITLRTHSCVNGVYGFFLHRKAGFTSLNITLMAVIHLQAPDVSLQHSNAQTMSNAVSVNSSGFAAALLAVRELSPCVRSNACVRNRALYCSVHPWGYRTGSRWTCRTRRPALEDLASPECPEPRICPGFPEDPEYQCHRCREDPGSLLVLREYIIWQLRKIHSQTLHMHLCHMHLHLSHDRMDIYTLTLIMHFI